MSEETEILPDDWVNEEEDWLEELEYYPENKIIDDFTYLNGREVMVFWFEDDGDALLSTLYVDTQDYL